MTVPTDKSPLQARMIFVVGARRSGTNWAQRILTAHPDVVGMPSETYIFSRGIRPLAELFQHATPGSPKTARTFIPRGAFLEATRQFTDRVFGETLRSSAQGATHLVERTPWHVYDLELIADLYPDAPIVHIIRDGRDVARSLLSKDWGPDTMEAAAEEWCSSVEAGRAAGAALPNYSEVFYERLLADPEAGICSLYERLGLTLEPPVLDAALLEARSAFNVDPAFPTVGTGKWRQTLPPADLRTFDRVAGPLLEELGYDREAPPSRPLPEALGRGAARWRVGVGKAVRLRQFVRPRQAIRAFLDGKLGRHPPDLLEGHSWLVQQLEDQLSRGRYEAVDDVLTDGGSVTIVDAGRAWRGRGTEGAKRLREAVREHGEQDPVPLTGEVHLGTDVSTIVGTYRLRDGSTWLRTVVLNHAGRQYSAIALYRHPVAVGGARELSDAAS